MYNEKKEEQGIPQSGSEKKPVYEQPGSTEHNDYKIKGDTEKSSGRDEGESYQDYNGNSEANNPARAE